MDSKTADVSFISVFVMERQISDNKCELFTHSNRFQNLNKGKQWYEKGKISNKISIFNF